MDVERRIGRRVRAVVFLFLLLGFALWGFDRYFIFAGRVVPKDAAYVDLQGCFVPAPGALLGLHDPKTIDLRESSVGPEDYERLCAHFPDCKMLYELPFRGDFLPLDTREITIDHLSREDVSRLEYLKNLRCVHAEGCRDYDALELLSRREGVDVTYTVGIGQQELANDAESICVADGQEAELARLLPYLPNLQKLELTGTLPQSLDSVYSACPELEITLSLPQICLNSSQTEADFSDCAMGADEIGGAIRLLPKLSFAVLPEALEGQDVALLCDDFPGVFFQWEYPLYGKSFPTDTEFMDLNWVSIEDIAPLEQSLGCFPNLKKVEMCGCGVDNETMDALNRRHADVRFIWQVQCGSMTVRTDAEFFMPVKYGRRVYDGDLDNLRYCQDIICVDVGHMAITKTDFLAYLPKLQYLVLADTGVTEISSIVNCRELIFLELFMTGVRDVSPLQELPKLEDLNLCYTPADPEPLEQMTNLKRLWWSGNYRRVSYLSSCLPETKVNFTTGSSTGAGWREGSHYYEMRDIVHMPYFTG